ncbi:MAG: hypothetical protein LBK22_06670 [Tannerella sp.]|jgi:hypothetical protein|nr:hypothetical protein [Tannerella sp.]
MRDGARPSVDYTASGMVLCIARQGIHINRTGDQQSRFIARQGIHLFSVAMHPLQGLIAKNRLCRQKRTEIRQKAYIQLDKLLFLLFLTVDTGMKRT